MPNVFEVKKVLDRMNQLGNRYSTLKELTEATALSLNLKISDECVRYASLYSSYEILCIAHKKKPLSLGKWLLKKPGEQTHVA
jgi:hypothetical protein